MTQSTPTSQPVHLADVVSPRSAAGEFLSRELSWLAFNHRVLHEGLDPRTPLLERLGFLAIFNSNLDEFYQKRVGGLKRQRIAGVSTRTLDGMDTREQLQAIREAVLPMLQQQADCFTNVLQPALRAENIFLLDWQELNEQEMQFAHAYFQRNLFPVLTPLAVDPGHPFPFISNLSMSLGVMLREPVHAGQGDDETQLSGVQFARVKVPTVLPRWVRLDDGTSGAYRFVRLSEIIRENLHQLFLGMQILEVQPFRVTRNADVERDEDAEDLIELIEQEVRERRFAKVIRLEMRDAPSARMNRLLARELNLDATDLYQMPGELDYTDLWMIYQAVNRPDLKFTPWTPVVPARLADDEAKVFDVIRDGDLLVHHPYESFTASVERFIRAAARDPKTIAIKLTLYRTTTDSPFVPELIRAAESGKHVVCLVELKARFDEQRNVQLAQQLERAGVHVVYGVVGYKTHSKIALVVRREGDDMRCYAHVSTGNYNAKTAQLYTDVSLFTRDPRITRDIVELFHDLTGRSLARKYRHLIIAPANMRERFVEMIDREIAHCEAWQARGSDPNDADRPTIIAKMNSLEDHLTCHALYRASQAGVRIRLFVRGFCCLRPGVAGLSENITVTSVIGRFLEHSRIYYLHNAGQREFYIGSADWMYRNLNNRVECVTPVYDPALQQRLWQILEVMHHDQRQAWDMQSGGSYIQRQPADENAPAHPEIALGTHQALMNLTRQTPT